MYCPRSRMQNSLESSQEAFPESAIASKMKFASIEHKISFSVTAVRIRFVFLSGITVFLALSFLFYPRRSVPLQSAASPAGNPFKVEILEYTGDNREVLQLNRSKIDILEYSVLNPSEAEEQERIKHLLDNTVAGGRRSFRFQHDTSRLESTSRFGRSARLSDLENEEYDQGRRYPLLRRNGRDRFPTGIWNARYAPYLAQFRQLLQKWARNKRYEPQVMKELLMLVKDPVDRYYNAVTPEGIRFEKPYRTCAVVGNSGYLLNRTYGQFIDDHEMVMRLNNARLMGFQERVGSKTTISFVNSNIVHSCSRRLRCSCPATYTDRVPIVSYICQVAHFIDIAYCGAFRKAPLLVTDARFDSLCTRIVRYYSLTNFFATSNNTGKTYDDWNRLHDGSLFHYSSGMQAVMLALGICENVDILGFGKLANTTHHYHTNQKKELALHDYEAEYALYRDLVERPQDIPFLNESGFVVPPVKIFL